MVKERLSRLQKWILTAALKNDGGLYRRDIPRHYFGGTTPWAETSVTRSIRNLIKKGYIEARCYPTFTGEQVMVAFVATHENLTEADIREYAQTLPLKKRVEFIVRSIENDDKRILVKEIYLTPKGGKEGGKPS
jgi:hypothetical protein